MKAVISVIVPIYNVEDYLPRCIDSLINQTYTNLDIILINDGSKDRSGDICDQYAKNDPRIRVIHQPNGGISNARNAGLKVMKGEFVGFVDPDDYIHRDMYKRLFEVMEKNGADIAESNFLKVYTHEFKEFEELNGKERIYDKKSAIVSTIVDHDCRNYVWNKLYKRKLWENIQFPDGKIYEDVFVTYRVVNEANKLVRLYEALYYYFQRGNSISNDKFSIGNLNHCEALEEMMAFMEIEYPDAVAITAVKYYEACQHWLQALYSNKGNVDHADELLNALSQNLLNEHHKKYLKINIMPLCKGILKDNYGYLLKDKILARFRLYFLSRSLYLFTACNDCINFFKKVFMKRKPI